MACARNFRLNHADWENTELLFSKFCCSRKFSNRTIILKSCPPKMVMDVYDLKEKSRFLVHMESETWKH